jgi:hypothetical protein
MSRLEQLDSAVTAAGTILSHQALAVLDEAR